jgi:hypothetical protein
MVVKLGGFQKRTLARASYTELNGSSYIQPLFPLLLFAAKKQTEIVAYG